jgi:hypothetical protein
MLKVPAASEKGFWGLLRACIASGGYLRRVAEGIADELRPPQRQADPAQLGLWVVDGEGLPPRPWRLAPDDRIACKLLGCNVPAATCVARQVASDAQRTRQVSRGQGTDFPTCVTERCAQGKGIREALDDRAEVAWKGHGPGGRFAVGRAGRARREQETAREAARRRGELEEVRIIDLTPDPVPEEG